jgi:hypothetical protein
MKWLIYKVVFIMITCASLVAHAQNNAPLSRTPEQEAAKQTEKMQSELGLTTEQCAQIYDINLRYARMRQVSNTRTEAMERIKNKNADIRQVLNFHQRMLLDSKRYGRSAVKKIIESKTMTSASATDTKTPSNNQPVGGRKQTSPPSPEYQLKNSSGPQNGSETKLPFNDEPTNQKK